MNELEYVKLISDLAKEVSSNDPIDFASLAIDEDEIYHLMASNVVEKYNDTNKEVFHATITHLLVENFILNLKIMYNAK